MVAVLDWGMWSERPYFVCEMVGARLLDLIHARGPMDELESLRLVEQIADVVASVHDRGYVLQAVDANCVGSHPRDAGWMLDWPAFNAKIGSKSPRGRRYISPFTAPEIETASTFAAASDVFALGSLLAFALTGSTDLAGVARSARIATHTTAASRALISALTHANPKERPTAAEARDRAATIRERLEPISGSRPWLT
ncbi:MAG: hypothetical protein H0V17_12345 [Deltaproteobacteria bacterium]|nr:hypothetical protein [Deltaproteobacteria bacterium]